MDKNWRNFRGNIFPWETHITVTQVVVGCCVSDMCAGKHASLGICVREETHITVTPAPSYKTKVYE